MPHSLSETGRALLRDRPPGNASVPTAEQTVAAGVTVPLAQHQFDALVAFVCEVGQARFTSSTLLRLLNRGDYLAVPEELRKWVKARRNGAVTVLPELTRRRQAEADLFRKPPHGYATPQLAGIAAVDAIQIGLGAISVAQAAQPDIAGTFQLSYETSNRMLTGPARQEMPGAQAPTQRYRRRLFYIDCAKWFQAHAEVLIEWQGNAYGEITDPRIWRQLTASTDWEHSSVDIAIRRLVQLPPNDRPDPRTWPITYSYTGSFDPVGNGKFEFSGKFDIDAFGGLRFFDAVVVSRSFIDTFIMGKPEEYVARGADLVAPVPEIPADQMAYLRKNLP
ncbi:lysozyme [Couchioplanes azureus]|uniref:lysozyme n=1 Tax=Couchioplanes caeruleus TaxID=56438 RepID=UPI00166F9F84|nr:lysozyme [Couchioplanes caeruleus]GGQ70095.1 hypothetical protein GCM10010166_44920 [Couchioplanes caeruleus subsp. azureus]